MRQKTWMSGLSAMLLATTLAACGDAGEEQTSDSTEEHSDHSMMEHSGSGEVPSGLMEAQNPAFSVDSKARLTANHMSDMEGAEATIIGAYDTTVYSVSYTPTNGGARVSNHKWVIHEELDTTDSAPLAVGAKVKLEATHMKGMEGAEATIDTAEKTTVYMVDYQTEDGQDVTNHKWVTEDELEQVK